MPVERNYAKGFSSRIEVRGRQAYVEYHYDGEGKDWKPMLRDVKGGFDAMLFTIEYRDLGGCDLGEKEGGGRLLAANSGV